MTSRFRTFSLLLALLFLFSMIGSSSVTARDAEQRVDFERPILVVNTSFLNVRSGPGVEYGVLVTVVGGTELPVLGVAADQVWYQVATDGGPGWVNIEFTLPRGDFSNVPLVTAAEAVQQFGSKLRVAPGIRRATQASLDDAKELQAAILNERVHLEGRLRRKTRVEARKGVARPFLSNHLQDVVVASARAIPTV